MSVQRHFSLLGKQHQDQVEVHLPIPGLELEAESLPVQTLSETERQSRGSELHYRDRSRRKSGPQETHHVIVVEIRKSDKVPLTRSPPREFWGPSGAFPKEPSTPLLRPDPQAHPGPTMPAPGSGWAALETEQPLWFQDAPCKICGDLERCSAKLQYSMLELNPECTSSLETRELNALQRNQIVRVETRLCAVTGMLLPLISDRITTF
ncbi:hypothetical protein DPEC_G00324280 [Dallia pectoralis]|uniref:Uncharacterized protein n=1 Tax=Dallia pectoralis TaxID=75939 RepID=A0ACC2FAW5_DALPE|nr:hypothetical protein DPEC_G00324280 [Dallia pectoralis]